MDAAALRQRLRRFLPKRPTGGVYSAQVFHLALGAQLGEVGGGTHGATELFHQVGGAIDETLRIDGQALQQFGHPLGNQAAFARMQAAAGGFDQIEIILEGEGNGGPQAAGAIEGEQGLQRQGRQMGFLA